MGFYGQVIYELTNAFSNIIIRNSGKNNSNFNNNIQSEVNIPASGLENKFCIDSGNKWVNLEGNSNNYTCKIYHSHLDEKDKSNTINNFSIINENDKAKQLKSGQYFTIDKIHYDNAGHITSSEPVSYQLPITEVEADISNLNNRVGILEKDNNDNKRNIGQIQTNITDLVDDLGTTNSNLNEVDGLVGPRVNFSLNSSDSLTKAFGNYNDFKLAVGSNITTVAGAFANLNEKFLKVNNQINDASLAARYATQKLCEALKQYDITIDSNALWEDKV